MVIVNVIISFAMDAGRKESINLSALWVLPVVAGVSSRVLETESRNKTSGPVAIFFAVVGLFVPLSAPTTYLVHYLNVLISNSSSND